MNTPKLGLCILAVNLPHERDRLLESIYEHENTVARFAVVTITEADMPTADLVHFPLAAGKNLGIRRLLKSGCDGIACIDADYIWPCGLFEYLSQPHVQDKHVWVMRRDIDAGKAQRRDWIRWQALPLYEVCWGSLNYLSAENWRKVGGWDERCHGWGGEDDILHMRCKQAGIERERVEKFPLMHIAHKDRLFKTHGYSSARNMRFAGDIPQPNFLLSETAKMKKQGVLA